MSRSWFFGGVLFSGLSACGGGAEAPPPNVLLISLDSVRADALTFRDPQVAPRMTALAQRGTVFTQAISGSSWTLPAHAQIFTGQPPTLHRVEYDDVSIDPETPTLGELFRAQGWATAGAWSGWYLAGDYGFERGFDSYQNAMAGGAELDRDGDLRTFIEARDTRSHQEVTSPRVVELLSGALEQVPADRPVIAFAHFFDPHYDFIPPPPWDEALDPDYTGQVDGRDWWTNPLVVDNSVRQISDRDLEHVRALYRGEIGWTDAHVGALLDEFERVGRLQNTLVVIVSDHGEEFFDHDGRGHRQTLYDEVLRVPLLVVPPAGSAAIRQVDAQVELSDVLPTLLDYARIERPDSVCGRSLRPAVEGELFDSVPVLSSLLTFHSTSPVGSGGAESWSVELQESWRTPESKLLRVLTFGSEGRSTLTARWSNLGRDPRERAYGAAPSGSPEHSSRVEWIAVERFVTGLRERYGRAAHAKPEQRRTSLAPRLAHELAGLGYAEGDTVEPALAPSQRLPWSLGVRPRMRLPD